MNPENLPTQKTCFVVVSVPQNYDDTGYNIAVCSTREKAEARVKSLQEEKAKRNLIADKVQQIQRKVNLAQIPNQLTMTMKEPQLSATAKFLNSIKKAQLTDEQLVTRNELNKKHLVEKEAYATEYSKIRQHNLDLYNKYFDEQLVKAGLTPNDRFLWNINDVYDIEELNFD